MKYIPHPSLASPTADAKGGVAPWRTGTTEPNSRTLPLHGRKTMARMPSPAASRAPPPPPRPSPLPRAAPEGARRGSPSRSFSASGAGSGPSSASASGARERRERERGSAGSLRRAWRTTQLCVSSLLERKLRLAYWSSVGGRFRYPKHRLGRKYAFGAWCWRQSWNL